MSDIEKVKNLLIKLDLKYKATKDQLNTNGIMVLIDFDKEYKEFNTINALDVLNNLENKLAITEKAQKRLAIEELEKTLNNFKNRPTYFDVARQELCLSDQDKQFIDFISNQIKELGGDGENE